MDKQALFEQRMVDILNAGALNLALAVGYRLSIFDAMAGFNHPATATAIADRAGVTLRYLTEWLAVMATGRIVEISKAPTGEILYLLPPEHGAILTRSAGSANLGVYAQEIPLLTTCAMDAVAQGFTTGQGVPFTQYPDFQAFMAELSNAKHQQVLVSQFLPTVDNGRLVPRLERGIEVLDLGCGQGVALNLMAKAFPNSRFTGLDNFGAALETARADAADLGLGNVDYVAEDAADPVVGERFRMRFDYITAFDAIHDQTRPLEALKNVRTMLGPAGIFSMVDIDASTDPVENMAHPMAPFLYTVSLMHCMPVGLNHNGAGLGMMWGREKAVAMLKAAGFGRIEVLSMDHDSFNLHFLARIGS
jgi:SAM-dependent methyltransferase